MGPICRLVADWGLGQKLELKECSQMMKLKEAGGRGLIKDVEGILPCSDAVQYVFCSQNGVRDCSWRSVDK